MFFTFDRIKIQIINHTIHYNKKKFVLNRQMYQKLILIKIFFSVGGGYFNLREQNSCPIR